MAFDCKYNYPQIARDSGFKFRLWRNGLLDWGLIGSLKVEEIIREQQFEKIDEVLPYLSEAPLAAALEVNVLDSSVGKYFSISQFAIQYLLFCRHFLDESVKALRESLVNTQIENANLKTLNQEHSNEIMQLHKKIDRLEAINDIVFPCHICTKNFVSNDALNIHLIKKHSNTPYDFQAMNNDTSLINTIKLELEVKHLKERLNTAEKDIRETSETKKLYSNTCNKISSSTQIDTVNVDIGTQCNLFEKKELDSTTSKENMNAFVTELQDKILILESWKESHRLENKESIDNISKTLRLINESLHSRYDQDIEHLKKIIVDVVLSLKSKEIIPTSINELQSFLSNIFSDLMQQNSEKLNQFLNKVEVAYQGKLLYSQTDIPPDVLKSQCNIPDNSLYTSRNAKKIYSNKIDLQNYQTCTFEEAPNNGNQRPLLDTSPKFTVRKEANIEKTLITQTTEAHETLKHILASYGLHTKTISETEAADVSLQLIRKRNIMQKINPKFITTRNKLKNFINNLSMKNRNNENIQNLSLKSFKSQFIHLSNETSKTDGCVETDRFKERLERILCSPIKKPSVYVNSYTIESIKPVPLPRKHVMFHGSPKTET